MPITFNCTCCFTLLFCVMLSSFYTHSFAHYIIRIWIREASCCWVYHINGYELDFKQLNARRHWHQPLWRVEVKQNHQKPKAFRFHITICTIVSFPVQCCFWVSVLPTWTYYTYNLPWSPFVSGHSLVVVLVFHITTFSLP